MHASAPPAMYASLLSVMDCKLYRGDTTSRSWCCLLLLVGGSSVPAVYI